MKRLLTILAFTALIPVACIDFPLVEEDDAIESESGEATYYADMFEGRETASGTPFRQDELVAAHRGYPFGTLLRVTNETNGQTVIVRVVDRGPYGSSENQKRTIIDLSRRAAERLDFIEEGRTRVTVDVLEWGDGQLPE